MGSEKKNVVFVDFTRGRRPERSAPLRPRTTAAVFAGVLVAELLAAAWFLPSAIASTFFGPMAIAVAVAVALGVGRLFGLLAKSRLRQRALRGGAGGSGGGSSRGTLH